jgi:hypothetical protein
VRTGFWGHRSQWRVFNTGGITLIRFDFSGKATIITCISAGLSKRMPGGLAEASADLVLVDYIVFTVCIE